MVRPAPARNSLAVLPFASRSTDTADIYIAEGIAEELANQLARTRRFQIKAPSTVAAQFRRTPESIESGRQLGVAWVVTGNVRRVGPQLVVNASLLRIGTAEQTWGARFARPFADIFGLQAEVAESVTVAVVGGFAPDDRRTLTRAPTAHKEAYRLYLLANSLLARRDQAGVRQAVEAYETAVRLDPGFAAAWARLAYARGVQFSWTRWIERISRDSIIKLGRLAARRAIALDSASADAWSAGGIVAIQGGDVGLARTAYERSVAIDSLKPEAWHGYGIIYAVDGAFGLEDDAMATPLFRRALALDPSLRNTWRHLALSARNAGRLAEAEFLLDTALSFGPWAAAAANRADVRFRRGNGVGALEDLGEAIRLDSVQALTSVGMELPRSHAELFAMYRIAAGDSAPAKAIYERARVEANSGTRLVFLAQLAMALGYRGEALATLELLRAAPDAHPARCAASAACSANLAAWKALHDPLFAPLRGDPRFERLWDETRPRIPWLKGVQ